MVIKQKDDIEPAISELNRLLSLASLSKGQRGLIEDEIETLRSGARGEKDAAYHIDFELGQTKNWAVIHDLRIEHKGRAAQVDHILIGRFLDVVVIESKNFSTSIRINAAGEFEVKNRYGWKGMQSPVEQNKRHVEVLKALLDDGDILPRRLGFQIAPSFEPWILVAPECIVTGRNAAHNILKMDMFGARMKKFRGTDPTLLEITKMISSEALVEMARRLVSFHQPIAIDYAAKFGIAEPSRAQQASSSPQPSSQEILCGNCGVILENKAVTFCRLNKKRFGGQFLCQKCQGYTPADICAECGTPVDSKVVAFCRFNSTRFGKKILCRPCQGAVA